MDDDESTSRRAGDVFREFAMACRAERDRIALASLASEDQRFELASRERAQADALAGNAIAAASRR